MRMLEKATGMHEGTPLSGDLRVVKRFQDTCKRLNYERNRPISGMHLPSVPDFYGDDSCFSKFTKGQDLFIYLTALGPVTKQQVDWRFLPAGTAADDVYLEFPWSFERCCIYVKGCPQYNLSALKCSDVFKQAVARCMVKATHMKSKMMQMVLTGKAWAAASSDKHGQTEDLPSAGGIDVDATGVASVGTSDEDPADVDLVKPITKRRRIQHKGPSEETAHEGGQSEVVAEEVPDEKNGDEPGGDGDVDVDVDESNVNLE